MKTNIFSIIVIMLIGIMAMGFTNKANNRILIQSTDKNVSEVALSQSAKIISNRLKDFSSEKFELTVMPEKNQIEVVFTDNRDLKVDEKLLTQKGNIGFYTTFNRKSLSELLKGDNHLFSLLNSSNTNDIGAKIGCCSVSEITKVNNYLQSLEQNPVCKFVWSQPSESSEVCLYALRLEAKSALLSGTDIESMKSGQEKGTKIQYVGINFKKPAIALWANITKQNIGNPIAIVLDNTVLSAPIIRSVIEGGKCFITGDFTQTEVKLFAALGNNGELPISFNVLK